MKIKRSPRLITKPAPDDWRGQVSEAFVQFWFTEKQNRAVPLVLGEEQSKKRFQEHSAASPLLHEELAGIKKPIAPQVWAAILQPLDGEVWPWPPFNRPGEFLSIYWENPEASTTFRTLTFLKYGITFRELISRIEASGDVSVDVAATNHRKLLSVHRDYYRWLWEGKTYSGLRLKFNTDHFHILVQGLDFGLDKLNEFELAECLDEICPCAQKHGEYLKKLRTTVKKAAAKLTSVSPEQNRNLAGG